MKTQKQQLQQQNFNTIYFYKTKMFVNIFMIHAFFCLLLVNLHIIYFWCRHKNENQITRMRNAIYFSSLFR